MLEWLQPLERRLARWEDLFGVLAIAILVAAGVLICVDVLMRYGLNRPILGAIEIIEYALVYITFLGASWAVPRGAHIDIDVVVRAMSKPWQRICALLSNLTSLGVAVVLTIFGASTTWTAYARHMFKPTMLEIPGWIVLIIIPVGSALLALRFLHETIVCAEAIASGRDLPRHEPAPTIE
jgi:C4-dicarboxylate transporter DctQ subunit